MSKIYVIGIDSLGPSSQQVQVLKQCRLLVGGARLLEKLEWYRGERCSITPLADSFAAIRQVLSHGKVGILASGDPLFYGVGRRLMQEFESVDISFLPALSSMQEAFARFKIPWDDATVISLHGRKVSHLPGLLLQYPKTFVFTDRDHSPDILAEEILAYFKTIGESELQGQYRMFVAENLGTDEERKTQGTLREIAQDSFSTLNVVCILGPEGMSSRSFGLSEEEISHSRGLITKNEVRAVTLHKLRLPKTGVFWDVGAGSGSISIEAARMNPGLTIYAIERKDEELENIRMNIRNHRCFNVIPVKGDASKVVSLLPDPDTVFIGGSGGKLEKIVKESAKRLPKGGRLVANGVIERTVCDAPRFMRDNKLLVDTCTVSICRTGQGEEPVVLNPITIMVGSK